MPWTVRKRGAQYCVIKMSSGETVACHDSHAAAEKQRKALYANTDYGLTLAIEAAGIELEFDKETDVNVPSGGHNLKNYWVRGPGAAKIRWGTDGSFDRCTRQLGKYVRDPKGLCAEYHKAATGEWPAEKGVESNVSGLEELSAESLEVPKKKKRKDEDEDDMLTYSTGNEDEPWEGILSVEGVESGDGRLFALGSLDWEKPPQPLMFQPANVGGHNGSIMVGDIQQITRHGSRIRGKGTVFGSALRSEHGESIRHMMKTGGVSVDVDKVKDADVEMIYADSATDDGSGGNMFAKPETTIFHRGRIRGATLVAFPAFVEAKLAFASEPVTAAACGCETEDPFVAAAHTITIPNLPKAEWFDEPTDVKLTGALTITDEGRVYGVLAPGNTTHRNVKRTVPRGNVDYSRFHKAETIVEGGKRIVTGVITASCGHAPTENYGTLQNRLEHYDNSCSVLANVRVGESRRGHVWFAGALNPGADPNQVAQAFGCALSGDWQPHPDRPGIREFIAAHLVPVPGFPMARTQASVTYEDGLITASSVPVVRGTGEYSEADATNAAAFDLVMSAKRMLAESIGLDPASQKRELMSQLLEV
jgi:hypothetical protein